MDQPSSSGCGESLDSRYILGTEPRRCLEELKLE